MNTYKVLNNQLFNSGEYSMVPIRGKDRYTIMQWRNEQLYHLRQKEPLTKDKQDHYFNTVVASMFDEERPEQILFSFLKNGECLGYGGLVHINWKDMNAEISFIIETTLEKDHFKEYWGIYLGLIEKVAFGDLNLHKIYTWAFDLRPQLYETLEANGFRKETRLKGHSLFQGKLTDVLIHSKLNKDIILRKATHNDEKITFKWASDPVVRQYSINKLEIKWEDHQKWFDRKLADPDSILLIAEKLSHPVGSFRLDKVSKDTARISYLLDPSFHGKGLGNKLMERGTNFAVSKTKFNYLTGEVHKSNIPSIKIFQNFGFIEIAHEGELKTYQKKLR